MQITEKRVLGITILGHALCHVYVLILAGALKPIADNLQLSLTTITGIGTVSYFLFGLGAFPAGLLATRTNAKLTLKLFFILSAMAAVITGFAQSAFSFAIGLGLLGLVGSLYHVSGLTLISQTIQQKGRAMGIHGVAGSAGIMITPLLTGVVLTLFNWRAVYLVMAVPGLIGFLLLMLDRTIPNAHVLTNSANSTKKPSRTTWAIFAVVVTVMGLSGFVYRGFMTMLPTYVGEKVTLGTMSGVLTGGIVSTVILSIGLIGQYLGGYFSDRIHLIRLYWLALAASLPFMLLMGLTANFLLIASALLFSLFHFSVQPIENHLISVLMPPQLVSSGYGIKFLFTFGVGSFAAGFAGYIADHYAIQNLFPILAGFIAVEVMILLVLRRQAKSFQF